MYMNDESYEKDYEYADEEFRRMRPNALTWEQLEKLPTPRLLAYYKKYRGWRWFGVCGCCGEILDTDDVHHNFVANEYLDGIKSILDKREHVPT